MINKISFSIKNSFNNKVLKNNPYDFYSIYFFNKRYKKYINNDLLVPLNFYNLINNKKIFNYNLFNIFKIKKSFLRKKFGKISSYNNNKRKERYFFSKKIILKKNKKIFSKKKKNQGKEIIKLINIKKILKIKKRKKKKERFLLKKKKFSLRKNFRRIFIYYFQKYSVFFSNGYFAINNFKTPFFEFIYNKIFLIEKRLLLKGYFFKNSIFENNFINKLFINDLKQNKSKINFLWKKKLLIKKEILYNWSFFNFFRIIMNSINSIKYNNNFKIFLNNNLFVINRKINYMYSNIGKLENIQLNYNFNKSSFFFLKKDLLNKDLSKDILSYFLERIDYNNFSQIKNNLSTDIIYKKLDNTSMKINLNNKVAMFKTFYSLKKNFFTNINKNFNLNIDLKENINNEQFFSFNKSLSFLRQDILKFLLISNFFSSFIKNKFFLILNKHRLVFLKNFLIKKNKNIIHFFSFFLKKKKYKKEKKYILYLYKSKKNLKKKASLRKKLFKLKNIRQKEYLNDYIFPSKKLNSIFYNFYIKKKKKNKKDLIILSNEKKKTLKFRNFLYYNLNSIQYLKKPNKYKNKALIYKYNFHIENYKVNLLKRDTYVPFKNLFKRWYVSFWFIIKKFKIFFKKINVRRTFKNSKKRYLKRKRVPKVFKINNSSNKIFKYYRSFRYLLKNMKKKNKKKNIYLKKYKIKNLSFNFYKQKIKKEFLIYRALEFNYEINNLFNFLFIKNNKKNLSVEKKLNSFYYNFINYFTNNNRFFDLFSINFLIKKLYKFFAVIYHKKKFLLGKKLSSSFFKNSNFFNFYVALKSLFRTSIFYKKNKYNRKILKSILIPLIMINKLNQFFKIKEKFFLFNLKKSLNNKKKVLFKSIKNDLEKEKNLDKFSFKNLLKNRLLRSFRMISKKLYRQLYFPITKPLFLIKIRSLQNKKYTKNYSLFFKTNINNKFSLIKKLFFKSNLNLKEGKPIIFDLIKDKMNINSSFYSFTSSFFFSLIYQNKIKYKNNKLKKLLVFMLKNLKEMKYFFFNKITNKFFFYDEKKNFFIINLFLFSFLLKNFYIDIESFFLKKKINMFSLKNIFNYKNFKKYLLKISNENKNFHFHKYLTVNKNKGKRLLRLIVNVNNIKTRIDSRNIFYYKNILKKKFFITLKNLKFGFKNKINT